MEEGVGVQLQFGDDPPTGILIKCICIHSAPIVVWKYFLGFSLV